MPLGSAATLRATGVTVPVGYDGDAYVEDLVPTTNSPSNALTGAAAPSPSTTNP